MSVAFESGRGAINIALDAIPLNWDGKLSLFLKTPKPEKALITNKKAQDWRTPPAIFAALHDDYAFTVDGAATAEDAKLPTFAEDAFSFDFTGHRVFCNPPFGSIADFLQLGRYWSKRDVFWLFLLPANIETTWFTDLAVWGDKHTFKRRIAYEPPPGVGKSSPSFASFTCMYGPGIQASGLGFSALRCGKSGRLLWSWRTT